MKKLSSLPYLLPTLVKRRKDVQPELFPRGALQWQILIDGNCCPICYKKLYWNRARTIIRCKSKLHSFVLPRKTYDDIVSGKRLADYKQVMDAR